MIKKISIVMLCCFIALVVAIVLPRLGSSEERVDKDSTCLGCHVNDKPVHDRDSVLHNADHFVTGECDNCHENGNTTAGSVKASACLACHPADQAGPGVNAGKCDLINFHLDNSDYTASGQSCLVSGCHLDQCNGETSTTTSGPASTTTSSIDGGGCPATEIYGEGSMEVEVMRTIRDDVMSRTPEGREIIKLYYQWAPFIAAAIRNDNELKSEIKEMIDGILGLTVK